MAVVMMVMVMVMMTTMMMNEKKKVPRHILLEHSGIFILFLFLLLFQFIQSVCVCFLLYENGCREAFLMRKESFFFGLFR